MGRKCLLAKANTISIESFSRPMGRKSFWARVCYIYQKLFLKLTVSNKLLPPSLLHLFRSFLLTDGVRKLLGEKQYHQFRNSLSTDGASKLPTQPSPTYSTFFPPRGNHLHQFISTAEEFAELKETLFFIKIQPSKETTTKQERKQETGKRKSKQRNKKEEFKNGKLVKS